MTDEQLEKFGTIVDDIDNLCHGLNLPLGPEFHIEQLRELLPQKVADLRRLYVEVSGANPWEGWPQ